MPTRIALQCSGCNTQIVCYGFADKANPPTGVNGPWLCIWCAVREHKTRPDDIEQAFTTEPIKPGSVWSFT